MPQTSVDLPGVSAGCTGGRVESSMVVSIECVATMCTIFLLWELMVPAMMEGFLLLILYWGVTPRKYFLSLPSVELLCCRTCCRSRLSAAPACTPPLKVAGYGYVCDKLRAGSLPLSSSALRSYLGCVAQLPTVHTAHCGVGLRFAWWQPVGSTTASDSSTSLDHCGTTRLSGSSRRSMVGRICTYGQFYVKRDTGLAKRHEVGGDPNCLLLTAWGGGGW